MLIKDFPKPADLEHKTKAELSVLMASYDAGLKEVKGELIGAGLLSGLVMPVATLAILTGGAIFVPGNDLKLYAALTGLLFGALALDSFPTGVASAYFAADDADSGFFAGSATAVMAMGMIGALHNFYQNNYVPKWNRDKQFDGADLLVFSIPYIIQAAITSRIVANSPAAELHRQLSSYKKEVKEELNRRYPESLGSEGVTAVKGSMFSSDARGVVVPQSSQQVERAYRSS